MELGRVGIWTAQLGLMPDADVRPVVAAIEELGFRALWYPESRAKEAMAQGALLLSAGREIVIASGIANIWARDATATMNGARTLAEAFPGRFLLGIGVSHQPTVHSRGHDYRRPFSTMRTYLDALAAVEYVGPRPSREPDVVLAALGPRMLRLAAERTLGAHPYFVPVEHTAFAREQMGPGPLLAPEQAIVLSTDRAEAHAIARVHTGHHLSRANQRNALLRLGWGDADVAGAGSDRLVDALVAWGDVAAVQARVGAHLEAGADHVSVQLLNGVPGAYPLDELRRLTPALLEL